MLLWGPGAVDGHRGGLDLVPALWNSPDSGGHRWSMTEMTSCAIHAVRKGDQLM